MQGKLSPGRPLRSSARSVIPALAPGVSKSLLWAMGSPEAWILILAARLVWSEGFGYADAERKQPVTRETQFRIGSVSKPLTATAVALLYEQRKLDLDAPVQRYVPSFPDKGYPITTRQLTGHLAGIRHYKGEEFLLNRRFATVLDGLTIFQDDSLLFPPGTRFS